MAVPVTSTDPDTWAADALAAATELRARISTADARQALTERVRCAAKALHAGAIVPVSETAALLVPTQELAGDDATVVLLEGHVASGAQLVRGGIKVRQQGSTIAGAIAISADPDGAAFVRRELGVPLVVLDA